MRADRFRLAIFTSQFPGRVNTFFARDVRALLDADFEIDVFPLYPLREGLWNAVPGCLDRAALGRIRMHHMSLPGGLRDGSWEAANAAAADLARTCASAAAYGLRPLAKTAYSVAKAWAWAGSRGLVFDHVLAYWGNYSATAAYVFHRLTGGTAPYSIFLHAGTDLYRQQVFLREKLVYADNVFVVCEYNRRFLANLYPELFPGLDAKIRLHHLPLDLDEFAFEGADRDGCHVVAAGGLEPAKGFDTLLRAAACIAGLLPELRLTVIGDGSQRRSLERLAAGLGLRDRVTFSGWRTPDEVRTTIGRATLLVHPSAGLGDAVPTVIKEALALGTPVVASDIAGIPELLDGGNCGVLVPPARHDALADAVRALLKDPARRDRYATAGRAHAEKLFDVRRNGPRLASILRNTTRAIRPSAVRTYASRSAAAS